MEWEKGEETAVSEQKAVTIPDYFASPQHEDDFPIIVEGRTLHVSKGYLGVLSPTLSTTFFDKRYPEARNGLANFEDLTLDDVLLFLCWAFEIPDPDSEDKTYGTVGRAHGIAMEDLSVLLHLADYWNVERLQRHCRLAFVDYVRNETMKRLNNATLLEMLEALPLGLNNSDFNDVVNTMAKSGTNYTDLLRVSISPEFRYRLCSESEDLRMYKYEHMWVFEESYTAGRIVVREEVLKAEAYGVWSCLLDPQKTAATLRAILPEEEAAAVMHGYQGSPAEYKEVWSAMTDHSINAANFSALLTAINVQAEKIGYQMACKVYSILQPIQGNLSAGDVFIQRLMLSNSEQLVDKLRKTCSRPLAASESWILDLYSLVREYPKLALAFPHLYAISLSNLPPRKSIGLPRTDWGNVLSRGCSLIALVTKYKRTDIDALLAYCAAFQMALSAGHRYGDGGEDKYGRDAVTILRLTRDHMDFYPTPTQDQLQALRTSVNLGGPSGDLNMVDDDGDLYTFTDIGFLLNIEWRRRQATAPEPSFFDDEEWGDDLAPEIRQVALQFVAECQKANIEAIHEAAVSR